MYFTLSSNYYGQEIWLALWNGDTQSHPKVMENMTKQENEN